MSTQSGPLLLRDSRGETLGFAGVAVGASSGLALSALSITALVNPLFMLISLAVIGAGVGGVRYASSAVSDARAPSILVSTATPAVSSVAMESLQLSEKTRLGPPEHTGYINLDAPDTASQAPILQTPKPTNAPHRLKLFDVPLVDPPAQAPEPLETEVSPASPQPTTSTPPQVSLTPLELLVKELEGAS